MLKTSKYKSLDDFYKAMDFLAEKLNENGFKEDATNLNSLMHDIAWTTGSELIGELSLVLKSMKQKYPPEISAEIKECLAFAVNHRKILGLK
jgi:putative NADPH-quinone reductase